MPRSTKSTTFSVLICLLLFTTGCSQTSSQLHKTTIGDQTFYLQYATTPPQITQGLMYVEQMPSNQGMLFLFESEAPRSFWMKNTLIPLDIIFLNQNQEILNIAKQVPPCKTVDPTQLNCPTYQSLGEAKYVLELNGGISDKLNIELGTKLNLIKDR
jgi:uncharacterized membrane protein (UPF0127 family)